MGKKKREHIVFDQMLKEKKSIPFSLVNKECNRGNYMSDKKKLKPGDTVNLPPIKVKENPMVKKMEEVDSEVLAEALRDLLRKKNEND